MNSDLIIRFNFIIKLLEVIVKTNQTVAFSSKYAGYKVISGIVCGNSGREIHFSAGYNITQIFDGIINAIFDKFTGFNFIIKFKSVFIVF